MSDSNGQARGWSSWGRPAPPETKGSTLPGEEEGPRRLGCGDCRTLDTKRGAYRLPSTEADHVKRMNSSVTGSL